MVLRRLIQAAREHDLEGEAAKIAFYFFLSLFPFLLILLALTGLIGGDEAFVRITIAAQTVMPRSSWPFVSEIISEITERQRPGALSVGVVLTLWAASTGIVALIEAFNRIWRVRESRGWWKRRGVALMALLIGLLALAAGAALIGLGAQWIRITGLEPVLQYVRWPLVFVLSTALVWFAYHYLPERADHGSASRSLLVAACVTAAWAVSTALFGLYVRGVGNYGKTYGTIGAVIVLVLWFYISAFVVLLGGEVASALEGRKREAFGLSTDGESSGESQGAH